MCVFGLSILELVLSWGVKSMLGSVKVKCKVNLVFVEVFFNQLKNTHEKNSKNSHNGYYFINLDE